MAADDRRINNGVVDEKMATMAITTTVPSIGFAVALKGAHAWVSKGGTKLFRRAVVMLLHYMHAHKIGLAEREKKTNSRCYLASMSIDVIAF